MIVTHSLCPEHGDRLVCHTPDTAEIKADRVWWIDMLDPTGEENSQIESALNITIPRREETEDLEPSELLWAENGTRYMTARILESGNIVNPQLSGITFILKAHTLVTVRYSQPRAFKTFTSHATKPGGCGNSPAAIMAAILDALTGNAADTLQDAGKKMDAISRGIFKAENRNVGLKRILRFLGLYGDVVSKTRESLVSIERVLLSMSAGLKADKVSASVKDKVKSTLRDLQSLEEHANFQSSKIQFLLDATLGLVTLEQNNIIKLFSVMSVILMPPTLVASIYGMNFGNMPELRWSYGYPMALAMMVAAAVAPYIIFRWKGWF